MKIGKAIERCSSRPRSHVRKEIFERSTPALANVNALSAIARISGMLPVVAPLLHRNPRIVFTRWFAGDVKRMAMCNLGQIFPLQTTAAFRSSIAEQSRSADGLVPAVAQAIPEHIAALSNMVKGQNAQPSKALARQIYPHHEDRIVSWRFDGNS